MGIEALSQRHERYSDETFPPHDWVFFNPHNKTQRAIGFVTNFEKARAAAGLPRLTSHAFRHYFISHAVMSGVNFLTIAKWVGHKNTKMIEEVYGHLRPIFRQEQMNMVQMLGTDQIVGKYSKEEPQAVGM